MICCVTLSFLNCLTPCKRLPHSHRLYGTIIDWLILITQHSVYGIGINECTCTVPAKYSLAGCMIIDHIFSACPEYKQDTGFFLPAICVLTIRIILNFVCLKPKCALRSVLSDDTEYLGGRVHRDVHLCRWHASTYLVACDNPTQSVIPLHYDDF